MAADDQLFQKFGKSVPRGTVLFRDGEKGDQMYIIQSGKVRIYKQIGDVEKTLATLGTGEFFGEMSILNNEPRSASAEVVEESHLLVIDPRTFEAMIKSNAEISIRIMKKLTQRLREANNQISMLLVKDINQRVILTLAKMADEKGSAVPGGTKVGVTLSSLASMTGLDPDKVKEVTDKLIRAKLINIVDDGIVIFDVNKLRKFLEFLAMKEQFGDVS